MGYLDSFEDRAAANRTHRTNILIYWQLEPLDPPEKRDEANLPTQEPAPGQSARFSTTHADQGRPSRSEAASQEGPQVTLRLTGRGAPAVGE